MKIGVVADTHSQEIPKQLLNDFKNVDFIIHAGDFCSADDFKIFSQLKNVEAVYGNMDDQKIRQLFPVRQILRVEGVAIGLCHGYGPPDRIFETVKEEFKKDKVDAVIFGHSHYSLNKRVDNVLYFNPGSPNDTIRAPYKSYGILEVKDGKIRGSIIKVTS